MKFRLPPPSEWPRIPARIFFHQADERIYAVVRIAFALVALANLLSLWPQRHAFFSGGGILDVDAARAEAGLASHLSVFAFFRSEIAVTGFMAATAAVLVMLAAGFASRLAAAWAFAWHFSYVTRCPPAMTGWDFVLFTFSFLVLISPQGKCWTLPALLRGGIARAPVPAYGLVLMRLQVLVIYWQTALWREVNHDKFWGSGDFLSYFMLSHHARWPGPWVFQWDGMLQLATHAVQFVEMGIPVLLLFKRTHRWGMLLGLCFHAGICIFAHSLGLFLLAMLMTYAAFLRTEDVDAAARFLSRRFHKGGGMANSE